MARKPKIPEFENHERWLVSYADMLTLLFAVFVVLYSIKMSEDKGETNKITGSMQESFSTPLEEIPMDRRIGPTEAGYGVFEYLRGNQARSPFIKKYPGMTENIKVIEDDMNRINMQLEERLYGPNKYIQGQGKGEERIVNVQRTSKGFKLQLLARNFYDSGEVTVKRGALKALDHIVNILKDLGRDVTVEGHTDTVPPKGDLTNWEISTLRATNIVKYMIRNHNFPPSKVSAAGYADTKPVAHNSTESGRMLNRRTEFHINYDTGNE